ncbi:MAG: Crp/Fnr family transcriptional regulator [Leptospiraceae bacterium]|nr:Crp/Fnr family transcriptional regulator [Leptospiraceae bacterium]MBK7057275.1 Crp/Fnr family transcriptional regulator [Leptospiraceae bacterium]MBK9502691.1 Crp/Fnr family transcriptional regulator [Leptospiraceae bacterium]MBL0266973.1 Crp/Fnr family transcriptional regulator [Leptospiraceae bacterium]MBP6738559.1 Crp/Fnr family transcriptional regulator [Leptospiraceae bacterium]
MLEAMFGKFGKVFKPNEIIFCEYEPGNDFYLIQEGQVKITKTVGSSIKTLDVLESGDIFGEMAILEEQPRSATAVCITEVRALNFNRANFELLMTKNPQLALRVLTIFSTRIYDAKRRLMILLMDDIIGKVSDVFMMLYEKQGINDHQKEITLKVTVDDVGHWCGQPVGEVQKVLAQLKKSGKIDIYADRVVVHNIQEFQRIVAQKRKEK